MTDVFYSLLTRQEFPLKVWLTQSQRTEIPERTRGFLWFYDRSEFHFIDDLTGTWIWSIKLTEMIKITEKGVYSYSRLHDDAKGDTIRLHSVQEERTIFHGSKREMPVPVLWLTFGFVWPCGLDGHVTTLTNHRANDCPWHHMIMVATRDLPISTVLKNLS